ncbi:MAG TPA: hypothetical protein VHS59_11290 [Bacillota bacterium]|nr:hypothetical protein [Bacillota bacterium]
MNIIKKSVLFGIGLLSITREKAEKVVNEMVERGEVGREEAKGFVNDLLAKGEQEKLAMQETIREEIDALRRKMGFVTQAELTSLEARLNSIEARLNKPE